MKSNSLKQYEKIWVAGHNGMVGSSIVRHLEKNKIKILKASRLELDLRRQYEVEEWFKQNKPDLVFLAAAKVGGIVANNEKPAEFILDNILIQTNILNCSYKYNVKKLIFLGSSCVYPVNQNLIKESDLMKGKLEETNRAYAVAKISGIEMCRSFYIQHKCNFISILPCNLFGPGDNFVNDDSHVIPALIRKIHRAKIQNESKCVLWGSGKPLREFLYVDDLADSLVFLAENYNQVEPINVGSGQEYSIRNIAEKLSYIIGYKGDICFDTKFPDGVMRKILNVEKISKLGWKPKYKIDESLKKTIDWYLKNIK